MIIQPNTTSLLDWQEIIWQYPNMWVMVGYPESEAYQSIWKERKGIVLYCGENEEEFAEFSEQHINSYKETKQYKRFFTNFTGKLPSQSILKRAGIIKKIID